MQDNPDSLFRTCKCKPLQVHPVCAQMWHLMVEVEGPLMRGSEKGTSWYLLTRFALHPTLRSFPGRLNKNLHVAGDKCREGLERDSNSRILYIFARQHTDVAAGDQCTLGARGVLMSRWHPYLLRTQEAKNAPPKGPKV